MIELPHMRGGAPVAFCISGMIASTFVGIFLVPALYLLILRLVRDTDRKTSDA